MPRRAALLAAGCALAALACQEPAPPPNVLFLTWDSLRADHVSAYGYERETTPVLDAFARESVLYERARSQHNWTRPSYASMLTSRHNWELPGAALSPESTTLAERLAERGYLCVGTVQNPNLSPSFHFHQGFHVYREIDPKWSADRTAEAVLAEIDSLGERSAPLFLFAHFQGPHWPYSPHDDVPAELRSPVATPIPQRRVNELIGRTGDPWVPGRPGAPEKVRYVLDLYDGDIWRTDRALGLLIQGLRERGLWEGSLVVFNSDHGDEFNDRGSFGHAHKNLHDELTHVPLIVRYPPGLGQGPARVAHPVQNLDIVPTVLDALGFELPAGLSGRSLLAPMEARLEQSSLDRYVALRDERHALMADFSGDGARLQLYDRRSDPAERQPLPNPGRNAEAAALRRAAREWAETQRAAEASVPELSPELVERLRALGYTP